MLLKAVWCNCKRFLLTTPMRKGCLWNYASVLQLPRCRIQSTSSHPSTSLGCFWSKNLSLLVSSDTSGPEFNSSQGLVHGGRIVRSLSTRIRQRTSSGSRKKPLDETSISNSISSSSFRSKQLDDAQEKILGIQKLKDLVKFFVMDIETSGLCRKRGRIVEIALRDLSGGENSCFQTLVNPEKDIQNSEFHGITADMVNHPHVPRMQDLIPILKQYVKSRQIPGGRAVLVAHNGRCFDFLFLREEFRRCSMAIPSDWLFLDTLPLGRQLMQSDASKLPTGISMKALCEYYEIPFVDSAHRAMTDVNLLTSILERMTYQLKITVPDLLERSKSFDALDKVNLKPKRQMRS